MTKQVMELNDVEEISRKGEQEGQDADSTTESRERMDTRRAWR